MPGAPVQHERPSRVVEPTSVAASPTPHRLSPSGER